jgi:hypothetical protein
MAVPAAVVATVLVAVLWRAAYGAPPRNPDPVAAAGWLISGVILLGFVVLHAGGATLGLVLNATAVIALSIAGWWMRGCGRDDGDDDPQGEDPPPDWDEFDRVRDDWSRPRTLA